MAFDFPSSPTTGQTYSISGGPTYVYNGTAWVVLTPGNQFNRTVFTATAGQTTFTMNYVVGAIDVYRNGVKLAPADFTATNGTSIVLLNAATAGDTIEVISYPMITYSDAVKRTGDVMTGTLDVPTNAAAGTGLRIRQPSGDASPAILQFTNGAATGQLSTISATGANKLSFNDGGGIAMMSIDAGRVVMPYQPCVFAQRTAGSYANTNTVLLWDNVQINTGSCYNSGTGRFTAPVAGNYKVTAHYIGSPPLDVFIQKNGNTITSAHQNHNDTWDNSSLQAIVNCAANDYITVFVQSSGGTLFGGNGAGSAYNGFSVHLIG